MGAARPHSACGWDGPKEARPEVDTPKPHTHAHISACMCRHTCTRGAGVHGDADVHGPEIPRGTDMTALRPVLWPWPRSLSQGCARHRAVGMAGGGRRRGSSPLLLAQADLRLVAALQGSCLC